MVMKRILIALAVLIAVGCCPGISLSTGQAIAGTTVQHPKPPPKPGSPKKPPKPKEPKKAKEPKPPKPSKKPKPPPRPPW